MENFETYDTAEFNLLSVESELDSASFIEIQDSSLVAIDSSLLMPSDTTFRFWQVQSDPKLFIGDSRYPADTIYLERLSWKGLQMKPREIDHAQGDWLTIVLFLSFILLSTVSAGFSKYISSLYQSLINYPTAFRLFREKNYSILHGAFRLEVLFYLIFSIFVFQIIVLSTTNNSLYNITVFGKTFALVVVYFLVKKMAYKALGSIFIDAADTSEFLFNMDNFNRGAGIILLPIVALIAYFPSENPLIAVVLGVFTTLVFYIMLLKRGLSILIKKQFPIFYLFLYLCTLEFLPLLLMYKIAVD